MAKEFRPEHSLSLQIPCLTKEWIELMPCLLNLGFKSAKLITKDERILIFYRSKLISVVSPGVSTPNARIPSTPTCPETPKRKHSIGEVSTSTHPSRSRKALFLPGYSPSQSTFMAEDTNANTSEAMSNPQLDAAALIPPSSSTLDLTLSSTLSYQHWQQISHLRIVRELRRSGKMPLCHQLPLRANHFKAVLSGTKTVLPCAYSNLSSIILIGDLIMLTPGYNNGYACATKVKAIKKFPNFFSLFSEYSMQNILPGFKGDTNDAVNYFLRSPGFMIRDNNKWNGVKAIVIELLPIESLQELLQRPLNEKVDGIVFSNILVGKHPIKLDDAGESK